MRWLLHLLMMSVFSSATAPLFAKPVDARGKMAPQPAPAVAPSRKMSDSDRARQLTNDFAICVLKSSPRAVERAVMLPTVMSYDALTKLARSECLVSGQIVIPRQLMRVAAYRALYIRDYRKQVPELSGSAMGYVSVADSDSFSQEIARLNSFGSCVARANPASAHSLVLANAATDEEGEAIDGLRQNLADCLPGGTSVKFTKSVLQGLLAEVLYREAQTPVGLAQGSQ